MTLPYVCTRKRRYLKEEDALQALKSLQKDGHSSTVHSYKCPFCEHYHLGNEKLYLMNYEQLLKFTEELLEKQ